MYVFSIVSDTTLAFPPAFLTKMLFFISFLFPQLTLQQAKHVRHHVFASAFLSLTLAKYTTSIKRGSDPELERLNLVYLTITQ